MNVQVALQKWNSANSIDEFRLDEVVEMLDCMAEYIAQKSSGPTTRTPDKVEPCAIHSFCYPSKTDTTHFTCGCEVPPCG